MTPRDIDQYRRSLRSRGIRVELRSSGVPDNWTPPIEDCRKIWPERTDEEIEALRQRRNPNLRIVKIKGK